MRRRVKIEAESFPLARLFTIARGSRTHADVVTVTLDGDGAIGRGEATPNLRYDETPDNTVEAVEAMRDALESGLGRDELQSAMPPGAARNAVDCALWDLEAKQNDASVWSLAGRERPTAILTAYTLNLGSPDEMARSALALAHFPLLKLKLGGDGDAERLRAVRDAVPGARLIADANEAGSPASLASLMEVAAELGVEMIEQPLRADDEAALAQLAHPVPVCADESCHTSADVERLAGLYDMVNIKLDKTGGLTEALKLEAMARQAGLRVMVGCMVSTSLGLAPAQVVAASADLVDLDSGLYFSTERDHAITYEGASMRPSEPDLWG